MTDAERDELLITLREQVRSMQEDIGQIKHVLLDGNGQPSLVVQVATQSQRISQLEEERADRKVPRSIWIGIVVSAVLSLGSIAATAVWH
jgi:TolA-binding protein